MSWGGYIPLEVLVAEINEEMAKMCCCFVNEVHLSEFRDDCIY